MRSVVMALGHASVRCDLKVTATFFRKKLFKIKSPIRKKSFANDRLATPNRS
jgi:hypothetical protein